MAGEQILVVEDNEKNMKLFRDVLQAKGYRTLEATTGARAVELATAHRPDLVLMDIQLPDIDGVEALGRLRADDTDCLNTGARPDRAGDGRRPRAVSGRGLRRLRLQAGKHRRADRHGEAALRWTRPMSGDDGARILVVDDVPKPDLVLLDHTRLWSARRFSSELTTQHAFLRGFERERRDSNPRPPA